MFKSLLMLLGLVFVPSTGFAVTGINGTTTFCSGIQTTSSILGSLLSLSCSGSFALSGGTITDSFGIFLLSTGALTLDNISITASVVSFAAGTIYNPSIFNTITARGDVFSGATLISPVPEPSSSSLCCWVCCVLPGCSLCPATGSTSTRYHSKTQAD